MTGTPKFCTPGEPCGARPGEADGRIQTHEFIAWWTEMHPGTPGIPGSSYAGAPPSTMVRDFVCRFCLCVSPVSQYPEVPA